MVSQLGKGIFAERLFMSSLLAYMRRNLGDCITAALSYAAEELKFELLDPNDNAGWVLNYTNKKFFVYSSNPVRNNMDVVLTGELHFMKEDDDPRITPVAIMEVLRVVEKLYATASTH